MTAREILRQAFLPSPHERWASGDRLRWIYRGRLWMLPLTMLGNLGLWLNLRHDPQARHWVADLFLLGNDSLLLASLIATLLFLRRPGRGYAAATIFGAIVEQLTAVIWIQMTGTVTSYFLATLGVLAFLYRVLAGYWAGLAASATALVGLVAAYSLEQAGVLPRSSIFNADVGANLLPELYRQTAFISIVSASMIGFIGTNLLSRALERGRAELADARAELAAVVDEARLGRLSGLRVGRFQLGELLGRGGMGEVYDAHGEGKRPVAIKMLHHHLGADSTARARFRREAELVRRLPSAVAPVVLEVGTTADGADYIAMERLAGEDLGARLRRERRLTLSETVPLIAAIARAVDQAHAVGVVHRDLKPANVFLIGGALDDVRVLDFGIARLYESATAATLTESSVILGSPGYMPPEQALGDHERVGPPADVYALGAIAYRALAGQPAFPSRNAAAAIQEALHLIPAPPSSIAPDLPPAVDVALARALAKDPAVRQASAGELAAELADALEGQRTLTTIA
jgi:predicted Ser/Thr protein kinase